MRKAFEKPIEQMTDREIREWQNGLVEQGLHREAIRQEVPASTPAYGWDPETKSAVEYVDGVRYQVAVRDGKLTRIGRLSSSTGTQDHKSLKTSSVRKRKIA